MNPPKKKKKKGKKKASGHEARQKHWQKRHPRKPTVKVKKPRQTDGEKETKEELSSNDQKSSRILSCVRFVFVLFFFLFKKKKKNINCFVPL